MNTCGVYEIVNVVNGKRYVGSSVDIKRRWKDHKNKLRGNRHNNGYLQNTWNKYGENKLLFRVIVLTERGEHTRIENLLLATDIYEYNIAKDAIAPMTGISGELHPSYGMRHTKETRRKMSIAQSGKNNPHYGKTGNLASWFGKHHTEEERRKIGKAQVGNKNHNWIHLDDYEIKEMKELREKGWFYREIGEAFGVTRQVARDRILGLGRSKYA